MSYPFIMQGNNVTVVIGNKPHTISKTHITYQKVVDAIKQGDWDTVKDIIEPKKVVLDFGQGRVSIKGETLYWDGEVFNGTIAVRMINMLQEGFTIEPLVKFMENLLENPSKRSVDELYTFLEKNNLPITPDGHFLAYKRVRENYLDVHSGTMDNSPGRIVEMADRDTLYRQPLHPYTRALMSAIPDPVSRARRNRQRIVLSGEVPSPSNPPAGCNFHSRCPIAKDQCTKIAPILELKSNGTQVACHLVE